MVHESPTRSPSHDGTVRVCRLVRLPEVLHRTGLSRSTVYRRVELGQFPKPYPLSTRIVAWSENEIDEWIAERLCR
jgi:prophage regulatory protein